MSILLKNARVVTADSDAACDILIEGETIAALGRNLSAEGAEVIDCTGKIVMPGGIDPHVHLEMPFMGTFSSDTYETGTRAALHGGTTTVIDFILQKQGSSLRSALEEWQGRAQRSLESFPFVEALFGRRSRRFAVGATLPDGPLAYSSKQAPLPLTRAEELLVLMSVAGNTGWNYGIMRH